MSRVLALCVALSASVCLQAEPDAAQEQQVKSAFLYNFTKFVEWPAARFASPGDPIVLGVFGDADILDTLEVVVRGRTVNGRTLVVRRVVTVQEVRSTHLVFAAASEDTRFAAISAALRDDAVLTVGESPDFLAEGGSIRLLLMAGKLRFEINAAAAERAHLKISAQLQSLAVAAARSQ